MKNLQDLSRGAERGTIVTPESGATQDLGLEVNPEATAARGVETSGACDPLLQLQMQGCQDKPHRAETRGLVPHSGRIGAIALDTVTLSFYPLPANCAAVVE